MRKITLILGALLASLTSIAQGETFPTAVETFPVVPRSSIEPIPLSLEPLKPLDSGKKIDVPVPQAPVYEPLPKSSEIKNPKPKQPKEVDMMELVRKEHARNVAKDNELAKKREQEAKKNKSKEPVKKPTSSKKVDSVSKTKVSPGKDKQSPGVKKTVVSKSSSKSPVSNNKKVTETNKKVQATVKKVNTPKKVDPVKKVVKPDAKKVQVKHKQEVKKK